MLSLIFLAKVSQTHRTFDIQWRGPDHFSVVMVYLVYYTSIGKLQNGSYFNQKNSKINWKKISSTAYNKINYKV